MGAVGFGFGFALGKFLFRVTLRLLPFLIVAGIAIALFVPATPRAHLGTRVGVADRVESAVPETVPVKASVQYDSPFDDVAATVTNAKGDWIRVYSLDDGGEAQCTATAVDKHGVGSMSCSFTSATKGVDAGAIMRRFRTDYEAAHCWTDPKSGKVAGCHP